jgi:hypothetical protein
MRRWHAERVLMLRRWQMEIGEHEDMEYMTLAPIPPRSCDERCHCYRGPGFMRKRRPYTCGKPRCGICKPGKVWGRKARATKLRKAIDYELNAAWTEKELARGLV